MPGMVQVERDTDNQPVELHCMHLVDLLRIHVSWHQSTGEHNAHTTERSVLLNCLDSLVAGGRT
jgi:hypothetical protein